MSMSRLYFCHVADPSKLKLCEPRTFIRASSPGRALDYWREMHGLTCPFTAPYRGQLICGLEPPMDHDDYEMILRVDEVGMANIDGPLGWDKPKSAGVIKLVGFVMPTP